MRITTARAAEVEPQYLALPNDIRLLGYRPVQKVMDRTCS